MNENENHHLPSESNPIPTEEKYSQLPGTDTEQVPPSPELDEEDEEKKPKEGLSFNWFNLVLGVAIFFWLSDSGNILSDDFSIYPYLAIVVIVHELGHVIIGKSFGCIIKEMQVFFLSFISYKPKNAEEGNSWRNITWSLGVLPLGGVTIFKSRASSGKDNVALSSDGESDLASSGSEQNTFSSSDGENDLASSPYIEDKAAWQRMLISAAGVLFNLATFLIIYLAMPYMSDELYDLLWPLMSLSLILALLNILPIYPLDGGAIVFALYEMITGKKPSSGFTTVCSWIGLIFIILFFWVFPEWLGGILETVFGWLF